MTTWHLLAEAEVKEILEIPKGVRTYALIRSAGRWAASGPSHEGPSRRVIRRDHL